MIPALILSLLIFAPFGANAQVASYSVQRVRWLSQIGDNPVPLLYQFSASVSGSALRAATVTTPTTSAPLDGNTLVRQFSTNFPASSVVDNQPVDGLDLLNQSFPTGDYQMGVAWIETHPPSGIVIPRTNNFDASLNLDFSAIDPQITNIPPLSFLSSTQDFAWPIFTSDANSYATFTLLEGTFDTNLFAQVAYRGPAALSNLSIVLPRYSHLDPSVNSVTYTNLDTSLDHLAWIEFHQVDGFSSAIPYMESASVTANLILYRPTPPPVSLGISPSGTAVVLSWPASGGNAYHVYQSSELQTWAITTWPISTNGASYQVSVPIEDSAHFFRLQAP